MRSAGEEEEHFGELLAIFKLDLVAEGRQEMGSAGWCEWVVMRAVAARDLGSFNV